MSLRPVWAEINLAALANNIKEIRRITNPQSKICAVVKANAYGHGAVEISRIALQNGTAYLAVALLDEARQLRNAGIDAPILILGNTPDYLAPEVISLDITQTVFNFQSVKVLSEAAVKVGKTVKIHIKIDTGMSRIGFFPIPETVTIIKDIARLPNIEMEGIFTHFASSDAPDKSVARKQLDAFMHFNEKLQQEGINIPLRHIANSAATIDLPESHLDMVRIGISLYGFYPSEHVHKEKLNLIPVMSLKTKIVHIKKITVGTGVSYGGTWVTDRETVVATLPLGYADGYTRLLSNKGEVLIHGQRANIIGTVCMDQCMADVTHIPDVQVGDEVVLFGSQEGELITVEELAGKIGTINYEIVCMISQRVPRIYT